MTKCNNMQQQVDDEGFVTVLPRIVDPTLELSYQPPASPKQMSRPVSRANSVCSVKDDVSEPKNSSPQGVKADTECARQPVSNVKYYVLLTVFVLLTGVLIYFIYKYFQQPQAIPPMQALQSYMRPSNGDANSTQQVCQQGENPSITTKQHDVKAQSALSELSKYINFDSSKDDTKDADSKQPEYDNVDVVSVSLDIIDDDNNADNNSAHIDEPKPITIVHTQPAEVVNTVLDIDDTNDDEWDSHSLLKEQDEVMAQDPLLDDAASDCSIHSGASDSSLDIFKKYANAN